MCGTFCDRFGINVLCSNNTTLVPCDLRFWNPVNQQTHLQHLLGAQFCERRSYPEHKTPVPQELAVGLAGNVTTPLASLITQVDF